MDYTDAFIVAVIASAAKQSRKGALILDCFAALAMTNSVYPFNIITLKRIIESKH